MLANSKPSSTFNLFTLLVGTCFTDMWTSNKSALGDIELYGARHLAGGQAKMAPLIMRYLPHNSCYTMFCGVYQIVVAIPAPNLTRPHSRPLPERGSHLLGEGNGPAGIVLLVASREIVAATAVWWPTRASLRCRMTPQLRMPQTCWSPLPYKSTS